MAIPTVYPYVVAVDRSIAPNVAGLTVTPLLGAVLTNAEQLALTFDGPLSPRDKATVDEFMLDRGYMPL